jgi:hypothetical protein
MNHQPSIYRNARVVCPLPGAEVAVIPPPPPGKPAVFAAPGFRGTVLRGRGAFGRHEVLVRPAGGATPPKWWPYTSVFLWVGEWSRKARFGPPAAS